MALANQPYYINSAESYQKKKKRKNLNLLISLRIRRINSLQSWKDSNISVLLAILG